jgi:hypothetical protein
MRERLESLEAKRQGLIQALAALGDFRRGRSRRITGGVKRILRVRPP